MATVYYIPGHKVGATTQPLEKRLYQQKVFLDEAIILADNLTAVEADRLEKVWKQRLGFTLWGDGGLLTQLKRNILSQAPEAKKKQAESIRITNKKTNSTKRLQTPQARKKRAITNSKPIKQIDTHTLEVVKVWPSLTAANKGMNLKFGISAVTKGKQKTAGGYFWDFAVIGEKID